MASGTFESTTGANLEIGCDWSSTPNTAANTSTVRVRVYIKHYDIYCVALSGSYVALGDDTQYFAQGINSSATGLQKTYVADKTFTVAHGSDGTKSVRISAGWVFNGIYSGHYIGTLSVSKSVALDRIARASNFTSPSSFTLTSPSTVTVSPYQSGYRHRVVLTLGGSSYTGSFFNGTSTSVTPPASLADSLTSSTRGNGSVKVETYSGNTKIGEVSKSCVFVIPESAEFLPAFTLSITTQISSDYLAQGGYLAAGLSSAVVSVNGVTTRHSATVSSRKVFFGAKSTSSSSLNVGTLTGGDFTYGATITDSRGMKTTHTGTLSVMPYSEPSFTGVSVFRCLSDGTPDDEGTYISVTATSSVSALGGINTGTTSFKLYARHGTTPIGTWPITSGVTSVINASVDHIHSYDSEIVCTDSAGCSGIYKTVIPTSTVDLHLKNGKVKIGGYAERQGFECSYPAAFTGGVSIGDDEMADFVVAAGTSGIWTYRKWASGASECYGTGAITTYHMNSSYGNFYRSSGTSGQDVNATSYPSGLFCAAPTVTATPSGASVMIAERSAGSASSTPGYYVLYPSQPSGGTLNAAIHFSCRGRWK